MRMFKTMIQNEIWKKTDIFRMGTMPLGRGDWTAWTEFFGEQMRRKKVSASPKGESVPMKELLEEDGQDETAFSDGLEAEEELIEDVKLRVKGSLDGHPSGTGRKAGRPYGSGTQGQDRETRLKAAMVWSAVLGEPVCRKRAAGRKGGEAHRWKRTGR